MFSHLFSNIWSEISSRFIKGENQFSKLWFNICRGYRPNNFFFQNLFSNNNFFNYSLKSLLTVIRIHGSHDLIKHCTNLTDAYYRCFVTGVFKSLQLNLRVDTHDINSAINLCEEAWPLEIDITKYLYTVCGHTRAYIQQCH